jgi:asparagine synthase (glutamine-hydrolysing)
MLSGGLDSTIIASVVTDRRDDLETWCASGVDRGREVGPDPAEARALAEELGTLHHDVHLQEAEFMRAWREHVTHLGQPLSTPNEVAIARLAGAVRSSGARVALSGEGADELFGGYDAVLSAFAAHGRLPDPPIGAARFHLEAAAWVSPAAQDGLLRGDAAGRSQFVIDAYERAYALSEAQMRGEGGALDAHLQLQRRFNLSSLLERLDAATMRHGVEGRTPFADVEVARYAESLPMDAKFVDGASGAAGSKIILRRAFSGTVPERIEKRPKASFPLPFETWCAPVRGEIGASSFLAEWVEPEVLRAVTGDPATHWRLTWLLGNLALWGDAVFGASSLARRAA